MVNEDEDVPNWILDDSGMLSKKVVKNSYASGMQCVDWGKLIWLDEVSHVKTLVLWKLFYGFLPIDLEVHKKGVVYAICILCVVIMFNLSFVLSLFYCYTIVGMVEGSFSRFIIFFFEFGCPVYEGSL